MKLKTSFFNLAVLKKDVTRFAPLWGIYTVLMLLILTLLRGSYDTAGEFAREADGVMMAMGMVNFGFAGLAALCLFGDLFKARLANALHAMPLRREGWFFTHLAAGLLFCLVPNALGAVISATMLGPFAYLAYAWLGLMVLEYLCFFGIGVFSVMCAGNTLGAAAVYCLTNFLAALVFWLAKCFYEPVLFGVTISGEKLLLLSPAFSLCAHNYVNIDYVYDSAKAVFNGFCGGSWLYAVLAAAVGLALMTAALFMYRRRQLEAAGDLIAFRPARPVFLVLYSLCVGALLYLMALIGDDPGLEAVCLIIGLAIGWFTGLMLLQKQVNVFRPKAFIGFGALVFAFYLTVSIVWLDPFGVTRYVPEPDQVQSVTVSPYASEYYRRNYSPVVTDPAKIRQITQIHQQLVEKREANTEYMTLRLCYTMKTGVQVERTYCVDANSDNGQWLKTVYSSLGTVLGSEDLGVLKQNIRYAEVYGPQAKEPEATVTVEGHFEIKPEDWNGLLDAIAADCAAGNMAQIWDYHQADGVVAALNIQIGQDKYRDVQVFTSCIHTVAYLDMLAARQAS